MDRGTERQTNINQMDIKDLIKGCARVIIGTIVRYSRTNIMEETDDLFHRERIRKVR